MSALLDYEVPENFDLPEPLAAILNDGGSSQEYLILKQIVRAAKTKREKENTYDARLRKAKKQAIHRFVDNFDDKVFGCAPTQEQRIALRTLLKDATFITCNELSKCRSQKMRDVTFIAYDESMEPIAPQLWAFSPNQQFGRIVLPYDKTKECFFIPSRNVDVPLPLSNLMHAQLERIGRHYPTFGDAFLNGKPHPHRDQREFDRVQEELSDIGDIGIAHSNRLKVQTRTTSEFSHRSAPPLRAKPKKQKTSSNLDAELVTQSSSKAVGETQHNTVVQFASRRNNRNNRNDTSGREGGNNLFADRNRYRIIVENAARTAAKTLADVAEVEERKKSLESDILRFEKKIVAESHLGKTHVKNLKIQLGRKQTHIEKIDKQIQQAWEAAFKADKRELEARAQLREIEQTIDSRERPSQQSNLQSVLASLSAKQVVRLRVSYEVQQKLAGEMDVLARRKAGEYTRLSKAIADLKAQLAVVNQAARPDQEKLRNLRYALGKKQAKAGKIKSQADEIKKRADFVAERLMATTKLLLPHREVLQSSLVPEGISKSEVRKITEDARRIESSCIESWCAAKGEQTKARNGEIRKARAQSRAELRRQIQETGTNLVSDTALSLVRPSSASSLVRRQSSRPTRHHVSLRTKPDIPRTQLKAIGDRAIQAGAAPRRPWYQRLAGYEHSL